MHIRWLDKNRDTLLTDMSTDCHLLNKFISYSEEKGDASYEIIATSYEIAAQLLKSFAKLEDSFQAHQFRFGWMDNEEKDVQLDTLKGKSILIGESSQFPALLALKDVKCLFLASKACSDARHIGFQRHLASHLNPSSISLGEFRSDPSKAETAIRTASQVIFNMNVMRQMDSDSSHSFTTGLDIYESCRLMRLAGLSTRLELMYINTNDETIKVRTAEAIAVMVWYYLEGQINKEIETMKERENDIFLVTSDLLEEPIKFVVGHKTGRWWYQHPISKEYMPCSDKDYKAISMGSLPDAIMSLEEC